MQASSNLAARALFVFPRAREFLVLEFHSLLVSRLTQSAEATRAVAAATGRIALIDYRLGVIALAVEETSAAQEALNKCAVRSVYVTRTPEAAVCGGVGGLFCLACSGTEAKGKTAVGGTVKNMQPQNQQGAGPVVRKRLMM